MKSGHLKYIINHRIRDYKHDIDCVIEAAKGEKLNDEDQKRIREDEVIIYELKKILSGKKLWMLGCP